MQWWTTVEGLVLPRQLAGHPALELVNTRAGWDLPYASHQDYLVDLDHLAVLARTCGALDDDRAARVRRRAHRERAAAASELDRARRLRADLHDTVLGTASHAATARLSDSVRLARARQRLVVERGSARWELPPTVGLADPLDALLVAAGDLLVSGERVGECPGHECGWLFLNPSGRRRWCQMAVCGNRAKQAAHARRTRLRG